MTTLVHRRPVTYETDQMIGFIDFDEGGNWVPSTSTYSTAGVNSYSYTKNVNSWLMFNHTTTDSANKAASNFDIAPIYYRDNGISYQYASNSTTNDVRAGICIPVQKNTIVSWNSYKLKETIKNTYNYHIFKELLVNSSDTNLMPNAIRKIGFIGKQIASGTLTQIANNAKTMNNYIKVEKDCWLYSSICHYGLMFNNKERFPSTGNYNGWVLPFVRRAEESQIFTNTAAGSVPMIRLINDGKSKLTSPHGILIPLKAGQCFGLAAPWSGITAVKMNYSLYEMNYSWNSFVTWVNFNDIIYPPTSIFVRPKKTTEFSVTAEKDCWAYIGAQKGDKWTVDDSIVLEETTNTYARDCKFVPLRRGQTIKLTYSSATSDKIIDWGKNIKFAMYGMKSVIESE